MTRSQAPASSSKSKVPPKAARSSNFKVIFESALKRYQETTHQDLTVDPLFSQLQVCDSPAAVLTILQDQVDQFTQSRSGDERLKDWINPTINVLYAFSAALGGGVGLVFPAANAICAGAGVLLSAAKEVEASQDLLINVFERIGNFFRRLEIYADIPPTPAMTDMMAKIIVEVLDILGTATQEMKEGRAKKFMKKVAGIRKLEDGLIKLDEMANEETRMASAQVLRVAHNINKSVQGVKAQVKDINKKVEMVKEKVQIVIDGAQQTASNNEKLSSFSPTVKLRQYLRKWQSPCDPPAPAVDTPSPVGAGVGAGVVSGRTVRFNGYGKYWGLLCQSSHRVKYKDELYPTALHLFEAFKFLEHRPDLAYQIRHCEDVGAISASFTEHIRHDWGNVALATMDEVLYLKFQQHAELRALLLGTHPAELIYVESGDLFWGDGAGDGMNELGNSLMRVRERFKLLNDTHDIDKKAKGVGAVAPTVRFNGYGEYSGLLYLSPHTVFYEDELYPTALHLFEALKFLKHRPDLAGKIRLCEHVEDVATISAPFAAHTRRDWGDVALATMDEVLYLKFCQHDELCALLLGTYPAELIYVESGDAFWGNGAGEGMNELGNSLMRVREWFHAEGGLEDIVGDHDDGAEAVERDAPQPPLKGKGKKSKGNGENLKGKGKKVTGNGEKVKGNGKKSKA